MSFCQNSNISTFFRKLQNMHFNYTCAILLSMDTGDILNIVIAVVLLAVGGFTVWLLYYIVQIVKDLHRAIGEFRHMIESVRERLEHLGEMLDAIQSKVSSSASAITSIVRAVADVAGMIKEKKTKRANRTVEDIE
jgi:prolipoprotein diacylglyceryltransferase